MVAGSANIDARMALTSAELARYSRHLLLSDVGVDGQRRLKAARVLCIGAGGLGSPAAMYLCAAGVGNLGLVDEDVVDVTNLQRQIIYDTSDVGRSKLSAAAARLKAINPHVEIEPHEHRITAENALDLVSSYDIVVDGTDNFPTRYLVNDACVIAGRPNAYGSIFRFEGQASVFASEGGPCYRCLHPEPPPAGLIPSCAEGGVLGVLPGVIGTIQATETIKLILGIGESLAGRFLVYDALRMQFRDFALPKDPDCPVCGLRPTIRELREYEEYCEIRLPPAPLRGYGEPGKPDTTTTTRRGVTMAGDDMTVTELKARMDRGDAPLIVDVRQPNEFEICRIPGAKLIPLNELPLRIQELDPQQEIVLQCKVGGRSAQATAFLRQKGFTKARNLAGGILAWIDQIDPSQAKY
jgi:adenylyltransferase/sulfurtransferase